MKQLLVAFFMLSSVICLRAQDSITLVQRTWAGGICCSSGTDISMFIPKEIDELNIDSMEVNIRGTKIHVSEAVLRSSDKKCYPAFGWSSNEYSQDFSTTNYYGISKEDCAYVGSYTDVPTIMIYLSDGRKQMIPVKFREEIIAYP